MIEKFSNKGRQYYALEEEDVNRFNEGVDHMQWVKGKLSWDENTKYIMIPGTGSLILQGNICESDEDIINNISKHII
jgi:hypothetical protein